MRRHVRFIVDYGVLFAVSLYGFVHVWWHGLALLVVVGAYGFFSYLDGSQSTYEIFRPKHRARLDLFEKNQTMIGELMDRYLQTGDLDALERLSEILKWKK